MSESRTGPRPNRQIELRRSAAYETTRAQLTPSRLVSLQQSESDIAEDPDHVHWRRPTTDGAVLDFFAASDGLIVKFRVASPTVIDLEELVDLDRLTGGRD